MKIQSKNNMKEKVYNEPVQGVLTDRMDIDSAEFDKLQALLLNKSRAQTSSQKIKIELLALKIQMEDYLNSKQENETRLAGDFLKSYLETFGIRQNKFANYIDLEPSNLSKMIKGERPINPEVALKISKIFGLDPMIWLEIQSKNELKALAINKAEQLELYSLEDLLSEKSF